MKYSLLQGVNGLGEAVGKVVREDGACVYYHPLRGIQTTTIGWVDINFATQSFEEIRDVIRIEQEAARLEKLREQVRDVETVQEVEWM